MWYNAWGKEATMKKNFGKKNWMFPMPVLMIGTYNEDGTANMMNAAWGGSEIGH